MNWYISLGVKIFAVIILMIQAIITLGTFGAWVDNWVDYDENEPRLLSIVITGVVLFCITIPITCWVFNL